VPDTPFPRVNSRDETRKLLDVMIASQTDEDLRKNMQEQSENLFRSEK